MDTRIGIIGTGYISRIHALSVQKCAGAKLAAVVATQDEKAKRFASEFQIERTYTEFEALLREGNMELYLEVPSSSSRRKKASTTSGSNCVPA